MARLPLLDTDTATGDAAKVLSRLDKPLNIFRMMAHAETNFRPVIKLGGSILSEQKLGAKEREMLIMQVAQLQGGEYEWNQHDPIAIGVGVPREQIDALAAGDIANGVFGASDQALLAFAKQAILDVRVDDATFATTHSHFSDQEIVEAIFTIGFYMMAARLTEITQTDVDPAAGMDVINAIPKGPRS